MITATDLAHLRRCVALAEEALKTGNPPFGALLVSASGETLREERNQTSSGDLTLHPELLLARWATIHLSPTERASASVYTSDEHCPMCAAAHGWAGLGRIVYAVSATQLNQWYANWGIHRSRVRSYPIQQILDGVSVAGPAPELSAAVHALQLRFFGDNSDTGNTGREPTC